MAFLTDAEIRGLISGNACAIKNIGDTVSSAAAESQVQPCSVDVRIDEIFLPINNDSAGLVRTSVKDLGVGESIRVTTKEEFALPPDVGGILFAPARVTRRGILVPDVGHIDPGFRGKLRLSLINLGKDIHQFKSGDVIGTVLLFRLGQSVEKPFDSLPISEGHYHDGLDDVRHLSPDFLYIKERTTKYADDAAKRRLGESGWRYAFFQWCLPIIVGVLTGWGAYAIQVHSRLTSAEAQLLSVKDYADMRIQLNKLEDQIKQQEEAISKDSELRRIGDLKPESLPADQRQGVEKNRQ